MIILIVLSFLLQYAAIFNIFFALIVIFFEKRSSATTWAWLMVLFVLPYIGFILYLAIGLESRKHITFVMKNKQNEAALKEIEGMDLKGLGFMRSPLKEQNIQTFKSIMRNLHINDLLYLNFASGGGYLSLYNRVDMLSSGEQKFNQLLKDIEAAENFIHIQYYIFRNDKLGQQIVQALAEKAAQGVEVRLLIDGMGNFLMRKKRLFEPLASAGGQIGIFLSPHFFRINFQNHRKLCVIDGHIGYIGGFNVGDEYMGRVKRFGFWQDMHMRILGDAVKELEICFIMDWNFVQPKDKLVAGYKYFPYIPPVGNRALIQIVSSGPDTRWPNIYNAFSKMISEANSSIYIQTPYFAPDENIFESLKIAALSGIDVKIMIPANPDHAFVKWCSLSYLGELLKAGVRCYEYTNGFIHTKMLMIDNLVASVGTTNMDVRSFKLNFEINAFVYDYAICQKILHQFQADLLHCREITPEIYAKRPLSQKIKEAFSRLLSPLL